MKIAINGLGRIGRLLLRASFENKDIDIVSLNTPGNIKVLAHLLQYDSIHGAWDVDCKVNDNLLIINDKPIPVYNHTEIEEVHWNKHDVSIVVDCSGKFNSKELASKHIESGAKKVIVSAPCKKADATVVMGINHQIINEYHKIISVASCTTNALAPIIYVLQKNATINSGYVTTIHSYTSDQNLIDSQHKDFRRARSASLSMIPTKTGAADNIGLIIPEMAGKLSGSAIRIPTANVSLIDLKICTKENIKASNVNEWMRIASESYLKDILGISSLPLVSVDFSHSSYSSIFDTLETRVVENNLLRILSWYDNEWAFSLRIIDLINYLRNISV